jgi:alkanesulfonate monooxygenase SsuD/methylene tetrahydromethanopterin reductase-like flavin-dependent oxidoreductase (luciferase family)
MKVGMSITKFGRTDTVGSTLADIAVRADESGIHSLWVMDHLWQIPHNGPAEDPMLECYTVLPYLAGITSRVQLGSLVTAVSYRHPGVLLKALTTLDVLSGGRAWLGIGAAWNADEATGLASRSRRWTGGSGSSRRRCRSRSGCGPATSARTTARSTG